MCQLRTTLCLRIGAFAFGGAVALASGLAARAQDADTLRFAAITEPPGLTLHETASGATFVPLQAMYESLLRVDQDMSLLPYLAESWQQLDDSTYEFKLRPGVTFHSGNPLTAEVVKETWDRHIGVDEAGFATDMLEPVSEVVVKDELTLEIRLKRPHGPFPYHLTTPHTAISDMAKHAEVGVEGLRREPSGTGPFMLERWSRGAELVLQANPDYWGGPVPIARIQFRFMPDAAARSIALQGGEVDVVESVAAPDIPRLAATPGINVVDSYELRAVLWVVNTRHDVLGDPAVRKAVAHAIDYDLAITSVLGEAGRPMHGFVPRETFGYQEHRYPYDPELAEGLLDEAGWHRNGGGFFEKDGQVLSWTHVSGQHLPQELEVAEAIQTLLREFGIDMSIQALDRVVHTSTMFEHASHAPDGPAPDSAPPSGTTASAPVTRAWLWIPSSPAAARGTLAISATRPTTS
jgi:peptide/nickel transport system substrate-binding protein